ncbi:MAG: putative metal-binding motif-containing protein, partial [Deltaproteobacteria bacterium]|nr:putative metal-binding motif-containing protein [Deltaproteobacteria bacterium]
ADVDNDGYGNVAQTTQACTAPSGYVSNSTDCNDTNAAVHPGAAEVCNGIDDNCDGQIDEGVKSTFYADVDNDGYGNVTQTTQACTAPSGYVSNSTDCNDGVATVHPGAPEVCNGVDDNCDGQIDEGVESTFYADVDNDGYGNVAQTTQACTAPSGYVSNSTDCNDTNAAVHPGAAEVCGDGIDQDCNGADAVCVPTTYQTGGTCVDAPGHVIRQPINADGSSVFKQGSTVPAKFRVCDANSVSVGHPGVVTDFRLIQVVQGTATQTVNEAVVSTTPDTAFRWDATAQQWIFNISTKSLTTSQTYFYRISLDDGSFIDFHFGLKK